MAKTEGNKYFPGKALTIRLSKCVKNQGPIFSPLSRKNTIFTLFVLFLVGSKVGSHAQGSESKYDITYFTNTIRGQLKVKKDWFQHFPVLQLQVGKDISEKF